MSLYAEDDVDDPLHEDSTDLEAITADIDCCDMMTVQIKRAGIEANRVRLGMGDRCGFLLVFGNDDDGPISDYTANVTGDHFYKLVMDHLD